MNLLLFSDVHANKSYCEHLIALSNSVDLVIGAGDFGNIRQAIDSTIGWLREIDKPSILVPGNAESYRELCDACEQWSTATVLHGSHLEINGTVFYGIGGGIPVTPFGSWSYDFTEQEAAELLVSCPKNAILISHSPPYGMLDVSSSGQHLGSKSVRDTVIEKAPILVVCGHIHESSGKMMRFQQTDVVNAGPKGYLYQLHN